MSICKHCRDNGEGCDTCTSRPTYPGQIIPCDSIPKEFIYHMPEQVGDEKKLDFNKPDWSLMPLKTLEEVVKVLDFGAKKYSRDGWKEMAEERHRVEAALMRHNAKRQAGQMFDDETGLLEAAHLACNAIFLLHYDLMELERKQPNESTD